jgi:DNA replicative helicase MCM subunit Mcm2 (Cdc46/Mcm family)
MSSSSACFNDAKEYYHERLQETQGQQGMPATLSINENINLIKQFCFRFDDVFMVVDALDECVDRKGFTCGLRRFREENENIKLLLTSRYEVDLERLIAPVASHRLALKEYMKSDIKMYLNAEIETRLQQGTLKLRQKSLVSDIVTAIEGKADGM